MLRGKGQVLTKFLKFCKPRQGGKDSKMAPYFPCSLHHPLTEETGGPGHLRTVSSPPANVLSFNQRSTHTHTLNKNKTNLKSNVQMHK